MKKITLKNSKLFSKISGDRNQIHINKLVAEKYFFREPIIHGINLVIYGLIKYCYVFKNNDIQNLKINFKNFCLIDEKIFFLIKKKKIIIKNKENTKIILEIDNKKKIKILNSKLSNKDIKIKKFYKLNKDSISLIGIIKHLLYVSKSIGNFRIASNTLIHSLSLKKISALEINQKLFEYNKIVKNVYVTKIIHLGYLSDVIFSELKKIDFNFKNKNLDKRVIKKIVNKKILIFGSSGDVAKAVNLFLKKNNVKIFNISIKNKFTKTKLDRTIKKIKPDYIFYFSSPKISVEIGKKNFFTKQYNEVFCDKFKVMLDLLVKNNLNSKVFYPSTIFLENPKKYINFQSYINSKKNSEKICKTHPYSKNIFCVRLPQFKTRNNYNMLGFYYGEDLFKIKKHLNLFFLNKKYTIN